MLHSYWAPSRYIHKAVPHDLLTGWYRSARVGLVTPLRGGMNLVAKEFLASQDPEKPGVLVLSRFAGAAQEPNRALLANPTDTEEVANALAQALQMPLAERRNRWSAMMDVLRHKAITAWRSAFMQTLNAKAAA